MLPHEEIDAAGTDDLAAETEPVGPARDGLPAEIGVRERLRKIGAKAAIRGRPITFQRAEAGRAAATRLLEGAQVVTQAWRDEIGDAAARIRSIVYSMTAGALEGLIRRRMIGHDGRLRTTRYLPTGLRRSLASYYACRERAEIAIMVANQYPGGDYFEFGSESFRTLMNFLSAFHLNGHAERLPDVKFFAFDTFGEPAPGASLSDSERSYFAFYRDLGRYHYRKAESRLRNHGLMVERCVPVKGYFEDTLNDDFKAQLRAENRRVGFAFLDCNIPSSYKTCFDFLQDFIRDDRAFIYMDEYFQTNGVPELFEEFCTAIRERYRLRARYTRNAGAYGALFILMREP